MMTWSSDWIWKEYKWNYRERMNEHWNEWLCSQYFCMTSFFGSHIIEQKISYLFCDRISEALKSAAPKNFLPKKIPSSCFFLFYSLFVKQHQSNFQRFTTWNLLIFSPLLWPSSISSCGTEEAQHIIYYSSFLFSHFTFWISSWCEHALQRNTSIFLKYSKNWGKLETICHFDCSFTWVSAIEYLVVS